MATREELRREIKHFTTLEDVLQLALAEVPGTKFSADSHDWSAALYELCKDFKEQVPELRIVSFNERPPLPPQTDEVYRLITTLAMSGRVALPNPKLRRVLMSQAEKRRIKRDKSEVKERYGDLIPRMANILEKYLCPQ